MTKNPSIKDQIAGKIQQQSPVNYSNKNIRYLEVVLFLAGVKRFSARFLWISKMIHLQKYKKKIASK